MPRRGRPLVATPEQLEQVESLAARGVSERKIAQIVFGDARYRGRVERILGRRGSAQPREPLGEQAALKVDKDTEPAEPALASIRELLNLHRRRLTSSADLPSLKEIELLLKLEREVEAQETLECLNALTREVS